MALTLCFTHLNLEINLISKSEFVALLVLPKLVCIVIIIIYEITAGTQTASSIASPVYKYSIVY